MRKTHRATTALVVLGAVGATGVGCFFSPEPYPGNFGGYGGTGGADVCAPGAIEDCYSGPPGTEGQGICRSGTRTCSDAGAWGACEGEVLPAAEICATQADEDCSGHGWGPDAEGCICQPGTSRSCYPDDPATENVGACRSGQELCNEDGLAWSGQCQGWVTPTTETCGNAVVDEDCDGNPCRGDVLWAIASGGAGKHTAHDLTVDSGGNTIVVGSFDGTMVIGDMTLTAEGEDPFVFKLDQHGNIVWAQRFGGVGNGAARGVTVAENGTLFVTGDFTSSLMIGNETHASGATLDEDIFVAALSSDGMVLWTKDFGDEQDQFAGGIATRSQGDIVLLTGTFNGTLNFDGATLNGQGGSDMYLVQFDGTGAHDWSRSFGDGSRQEGAAVALGDAAYATGSFKGTVDVGAMWSIYASNRGNAIALKRDASSGGHLWARDYGDSGIPSDQNDQTGLDIAVDASSNVLLTGRFGGAITFGGPTISSDGAASGFVAKLNSSGDHQWSRAFSSGTTASGRSVAVAPNNDVIVGGSFDGSINFGGDSFDSDGEDAYVFRLAPGGAHLWSRRFGGPLEQATMAVGADTTGNVLIAGNFRRSIDLLPEPLAANNNGADQTIFVAKLAP